MHADDPNSPHDPQPESLLEIAQARWLEGNWEALCQIDQKVVETSTERARIALFVASAHHQMDNRDDARHWSQRAIEWGSGRRDLDSILISGVYNTLGRLAALQGDRDRADSLFREAFVLPGIFECPVDSSARIIRELSRIGLLDQGAAFVQKQMQQVLDNTPPSLWLDRQIGILKTNMELLQCELTIAQTRGQLQATTRDPDPVPFSMADANSRWESELRNRAVSQLGQELWVLEKTHYKRGGFFVEFGATNGILLSNTYLLEKEFGWNGICAEPNPAYFRELEKNRSCMVSKACIGPITGEVVEFIFAGAFGGMARDAEVDEHNLKRQAFRDVGETAILTTISLHDFLTAHNAPNKLDYLSIDTEGSEFSILEKFPFNQWDIKFITVEHNFTEQRPMIRKLLGSHGYQCHEAQWDDWYFKNGNEI